MHFRFALPVLAALPFSLCATGAGASVLSFDAVVSSVPTDAELRALYIGPERDPAPADYGVALPKIGTAARITVEIDDAIMDETLHVTDLEFPGPPDAFRVTATIPGYLDSVVYASYPVRYTPRSLTVSSDDGSRYGGKLPEDTRFGTVGDGGIDLVRFDDATPADAPPKTVRALYEALSLPGVSGRFSADLGDYVDSAYLTLDFEATTTSDVSPLARSLAVVPLPGSLGLLLLGGSGFFLAGRRRH